MGHELLTAATLRDPTPRPSFALRLAWDDELDGMNKIAFRDDSVVCDVIKRKRYSETPRVEVAVRELDSAPA